MLVATEALVGGFEDSADDRPGITGSIPLSVARCRRRGEHQLYYVHVSAHFTEPP